MESGEVLQRWGGADQRRFFTSPRFSGDGSRLLLSGAEMEPAASGPGETGGDRATFRTGILDVRTGEELLGIDATDDPTHGAQERAHVHGDDGHDCPPAAGAVPQLERLVHQRRARWPETALVVRGHRASRATT